MDHKIQKDWESVGATRSFWPLGIMWITRIEPSGQHGRRVLGKCRGNQVILAIGNYVDYQNRAFWATWKKSNGKWRHRPTIIWAKQSISHMKSIRKRLFEGLPNWMLSSPCHALSCNGLKRHCLANPAVPGGT